MDTNDSLRKTSLPLSLKFPECFSVIPGSFLPTVVTTSLNYV